VSVTTAIVLIGFVTGAAQSESIVRATVMSDGHPLAIWHRQPANPRRVALLIHGRTWSSRPDFDLQVPGLGRSVMVSLAARGVATYAVDLRGYGATPADPSGWLTPRRAASDVVNVLRWMAARHPSLPPPGVVGWSRGAAIGLLAAQAVPAAVSSLVVFAFAYDPDARFIDEARPGKPPVVRNTADDAIADFISPAVTPDAVVKAFVTQALSSDPIRANLSDDSQFNTIDLARITTPLLLIYGDRDPGIDRADAARFFGRFGSRDKKVVILPGADHAAQIEDTHTAWIDAVVERLAP
jgi:pimeloyl-ACP methyl ester carboxylesterase